MSDLYEVEVVLPGRAARPFRVTSVAPGRAWQVIDSFVAAYGLPLPRDMRDIGGFAQRLVACGEYRLNSEDTQILVKRSTD